ncbi:hypothetical protein COJ46_22020 [Bacillus sp. AFS077874]|uniref:ThiF family adenylyltransferase n=1 Tax=Bacillus sp. AFS077874 TaxID=2033513 RepID=UPI000BF7B1F0|nr:ThiF family adenylyltransferase [Bacillus sp. AFS077874]PFM75232.1 hypothetical protein COJ46_22020 [Bacillus sp. AFS077874]
MDALHNLAEIYSQLRSDSINYLINKYQAEFVDSLQNNQNIQKYPVTLKLKVEVAGIDIILLISLPFNFPDSFPKISLEDHSFDKLYPLPHLNQYKTLCIFDEVVATPNPHKPLEILDSCIERAEELLLKGIKNENMQDYLDEFETYWSEGNKGNFLSLVQPGEECKEVYITPFILRGSQHRWILSDQKSTAINWIQNIGGIAKDEEVTKVLYIPLTELLNFPFPKCNYDVFRLIKGNKLAIKALSDYLTKNKRPSKVLFSMFSNGQYSWGVWEHEKPFKKVTSQYKGQKKLQTSVKGFRKGSQHGWLELVKDFPKMNINKYTVDDVRATRLKNRGGDGKTNNQGLRVAVIGCGAIGSHLAQGLIDIGIHHLMLVDNDILSFENINRHLCGASDVGYMKTEVVKNLLRKHHPTTQIHVYNGDVLSLLTSSPNALNSFDLIITAISNLPAELRLNDLQKNNLITKPILHVWVEPYLAGGHAIWTNPGEQISLKSLFLRNGEYKYQVLKNGNHYTKRELGCNTSFVPYGVLDLKKFILDVILFIEQQLVMELKTSRIFTWLGNLEEQKNNKRLLAPKWVGANGFTTRFFNFENNEESAD